MARTQTILPSNLDDAKGDKMGISVHTVIDLGIELIQGGINGKNPTIENWFQVIQSILSETNIVLTDYTRVRTLVYRLAMDLVLAFDKSQWFNKGLNQTLEVHRLWIATYLTFGAPWKDHEKWFQMSMPRTFRHNLVEICQVTSNGGVHVWRRFLLPCNSLHDILCAP